MLQSFVSYSPYYCVLENIGGEKGRYRPVFGSVLERLTRLFDRCGTHRYAVDVIDLILSAVAIVCLLREKNQQKKDSMQPPSAPANSINKSVGLALNI